MRNDKILYEDDVLNLPDLNERLAKYRKSKELQARSHQVIPGGSHTYAKGDDQYPELAPGFIARGLGCHAWDVDGNEYIEYGMGLRAVTLGHAYAPVNEAAYRQMQLGANYTRPAPIELECAEELLGLIKGADMAKFAKDGSTVTTAAIRLARAYTGRNMLALCADHPFFSYNDWFIATTPVKGGIPASTTDMTAYFRYNNIESVKAVFNKYPGQIACLILEPVKNDDPVDNFLGEVKRLCHENGALLIFDEMITGFRLDLGGGQRYYGVTPDLSTFGKGLANAFAVSALVGKREIMELGGIYHKHERVFLLSTTHGAETPSLAAALETMRIYQREDVIGHLKRQGEKLKKGLDQVIAAQGLQDYVKVLGKPCNLVYATRDANKKDSQLFRTLFMQEIIERGVLGPSLVVSYSHSDTDIDKTIEAFSGALPVYRQALEDGVEKYLYGRPVKSVYRKFN